MADFIILFVQKHPIARAIIYAAGSLAVGYITQNALLGGATIVILSNFVHEFAPTQPAPVAVKAIVSAPAPSDIKETTVPSVSYQIDGHDITVLLAEPFGTVHTVNGVDLNVGQPLTMAGVYDGTMVPAGAIFLGIRDGVATFELNGNFYN